MNNDTIQALRQIADYVLYKSRVSTLTAAKATIRLQISRYVADGLNEQELLAVFADAESRRTKAGFANACESIITDMNWKIRYAREERERAAAATKEVKPSFRLIRHRMGKDEFDTPPALRTHGRKVMFYIQCTNYTDLSAEAVELLLSILERMLVDKGFDHDTCPTYDEGSSCGFWVSPDEAGFFKTQWAEVRREYLALHNPVTEARA